MIAPRRTDTGADPSLVSGLLGAHAVLAEIDALLAELAEDGDRNGITGPSDPALLDVALGLAALSQLIAQRLPIARAAQTAMEVESPTPNDLVIAELLR